MSGSLSVDVRRSLVERDGELSMARQCELLAIPRSGLYYEPAGESELNLLLMRKIDEQYTKTPFYGSRRMAAWLARKGHEVNRKRVQRLMRLMGVEAIYPKRKTSLKDQEHEIYPYLLRGLPIVRPNQVWATDITYIRMHRGFVYLVAILDWFSRYVLAWQLSNTLDRAFCLAALEEALSRGTPEIFNSDQGCQFTSTDFTGRLKAAGIQVSMDGRGRVFDNIFTERLWRSVKYEEVYLKDYSDVPDVYGGLTHYFAFYNDERLHQALDYNTPREVHFAAAA
jgi:putative transposase